MDNNLKNIEISPIYTKEMIRRKRRVFPLQQLGFIGQKKAIIRQQYPTLNFSFILDGGGFFRVNGKKWIKIEKKSIIGSKFNEKLKYCLKEKRNCLGCLL